MKEKCKILIFCMIFVASTISAQQIPLKLNTVKLSTNTHSLQFSPLRSHFYALQPVPANFYAKNLGFFCRQEIKFEAATKIPLRFRIGSVNYCDWMEGKKNAGILPAY